MSDISSNPVVDWGGLMASANQTRAQTGQTQAQTGLIQQQTQAAGLQNQITQAQLPLIMGAISDYRDGTSNSSGVASDKSSATGATSGGKQPDPYASGTAEENPNTSWFDPAKIDSAAQARYFVPPVTQQEAQKLQQAALLSDKMPGLMENAKLQRQNRYDSQVAANQNDAIQHYEAISTVPDAEPGRALAQLEAIARTAAAKIKAQIPDTADEDVAAREYASQLAGAIHPYTGREAKPDGAGLYRDAVTGKPIPGVVKTGLSTDQWAGIAKTMLEPVDVPDGQGHTIKMPRYRYLGAPSLDAAVMQVASHQGDVGSQPGVGGIPKAQAKAGAAAGITTATKGAKPSDAVTVKGPDGTVDKQASDMFSDAKYKYTAPRAPFGSTLSDGDQQKIKQQNDATTELKQDASTGSQNLQQSQLFYKAAQDILDTKGASTGKWTSVFAKAGQWVPGADWGASNYQELAKLLGNAALQAGKSTFSHMTDHATEATLHQLNPSPDMKEGAVKDMIKLGLSTSQYGLDSARLIPGYLKAGGDATQFYTALAEHKPIDQYVASANKTAKPAPAPAAPAPAAPATPAAPAKVLPTGDRLNAYANKYFGGNTAAASKHLREQEGYK